MVAIIEIARNGALRTEGRRRVDGRDVNAGARVLEELLARLQAKGELRRGFDPRVMAVTIRAAIDAVPPQLISDPALDIDDYATQIADIFDRATSET